MLLLLFEDCQGFRSGTLNPHMPFTSHPSR